MNETCDQHMEIISDRLDEGCALPKATLDHLAECDECRAFHALWQDDPGSLADLAGVRDLPAVPPSLALDLSAARKTVAGPWQRRLRKAWPAVAAAAVLAAGLTWWQSGIRPDPMTPGAGAGAGTAVQPGAEAEVGLPQALARIDNEGLQRGVSAYTRARARSLDRSAHRLARLTLNLREATTSFSEFIPTAE